MIDRNRRRRKFKAGLDTAKVLEWYDAHRRDLPWRAKPAEKPDPYRVWLSEIMLQQTTVAAVKPYFARFVALWPDIAALAAAPSDAIMREWAGNTGANVKAIKSAPTKANP